MVSRYVAPYFPPAATQGGPVTIPAGWGERWARATRQVNDRQVVVGVIGDSIGRGGGASTYEASFPRLLHQALVRRFGVDGGSGFVSVESLPVTGAWDTFPTIVALSRGGPGGVSIRPTVPGNNAMVSVPVSGSALTLWLKRQPDYGAIRYSVDGSALVSVTVSGSPAVTGIPISASSGAHTVRVFATTGNSEIFGVSARNPAGVIVDNYSAGARSIATNFGMQTPTVSGSGANVTTDTIVAMGSPDVLVLAMGVNDAIDVFDQTVATIEAIQSNVTYLLTRINKEGLTDPDPPEIVVVIQHAGAIDTVIGDAILSYPTIAAAQKMIADAYSAVVVDMWAIGRHSWEYWRQLGYWGVNNTDVVHPSDAGHVAYAEPLISLLCTPGRH